MTCYKMRILPIYDMCVMFNKSIIVKYFQSRQKWFFLGPVAEFLRIQLFPVAIHFTTYCPAKQEEMKWEKPSVLISL